MLNNFINGRYSDNLWVKRFPYLNYSQVTHFQQTWYCCEDLINLPLINTSNGINFNRAWGECASLVKFPIIDTSNGIEFVSTWKNCTSLKTFPILNFSNGVIFNATWAQCNDLIEFPILNLSNAKYLEFTWADCWSLTEFSPIKFTNAIRFYGAWMNCHNLEHFPPNMFDNLLMSGIEQDCFTKSWYECNLTIQSINNILTSIDKIKISQINDSRYPREISLGTKHDIANLLTPKLNKVIKSLENKNWLVIINDQKIHPKRK